MPSSKSTVFFLAALAVLGPVAMTQPANALQGMGPPPVRRAEHIEVAHRMTKKRATKPRLVPIRRQAASPEPDSATASPTDVLGLPDPRATPPATTSSQSIVPIKLTTSNPPTVGSSILAFRPKLPLNLAYPHSLRLQSRRALRTPRLSRRALRQPRRGRPPVLRPVPRALLS
jgi:hypothetical protein